MKNESPYSIARRRMESAYTPAQRLAALREYQSATGEDWRRARAHMPKPRALRFGCGGSSAHVAKPGARYVCVNASALAGLRDAGFSDQILPRPRHNGYYADAYCDEVYRGQVWRLPARDGAERFICGYVEQNSGCAILDTDGAGNIWVGGDASDAARYADRLAERMAEESREDSERAQEADAARNSAEQATQAIREARAGHSAMIRAAAESTRDTARVVLRMAAQKARREAAAAVAELRAARETMEELREYL